MTVSGIGNSVFVSPYGASALKNSKANNTTTGEMQPDSFVRRHNKKKNTGAIIGNILLTAAAAFGIYKGRGHIKTAFQALKKGATSAFAYIKEKGIINGIKNGASKAGNAIKTGAGKAGSAIKTGATTVGTKVSGAFNAVKEKVTSGNLGEAVKNGAGKAGEAIKSGIGKAGEVLKSVPEKLGNLIKKFHK